MGDTVAATVRGELRLLVRTRDEDGNACDFRVSGIEAVVEDPLAGTQCPCFLFDGHFHPYPDPSSLRQKFEDARKDVSSQSEEFVKKEGTDRLGALSFDVQKGFRDGQPHLRSVGWHEVGERYLTRPFGAMWPSTFPFVAGRTYSIYLDDCERLCYIGDDELSDYGRAAFPFMQEPSRGDGGGGGPFRLDLEGDRAKMFGPIALDVPTRGDKYLEKDDVPPSLGLYFFRLKLEKVREMREKYKEEEKKKLEPYGKYRAALSHAIMVLEMSADHHRDQDDARSCFTKFLEEVQEKEQEVLAKLQTESTELEDMKLLVQSAIDWLDDGRFRKAWSSCLWLRNGRFGTGFEILSAFDYVFELPGIDDAEEVKKNRFFMDLLEDRGEAFYRLGKTQLALPEGRYRPDDYKSRDATEAFEELKKKHTVATTSLNAFNKWLTLRIHAGVTKKLVEQAFDHLGKVVFKHLDPGEASKAMRRLKGKLDIPATATVPEVFDQLLETFKNPKAFRQLTGQEWRGKLAQRAATWRSEVDDILGSLDEDLGNIDPDGKVTLSPDAKHAGDLKQAMESDPKVQANLRRRLGLVQVRHALTIVGTALAVDQAWDFLAGEGDGSDLERTAEALKALGDILSSIDDLATSIKELRGLARWKGSAKAAEAVAKQGRGWVRSALASRFLKTGTVIAKGGGRIVLKLAAPLALAYESIHLGMSWDKSSWEQNTRNGLNTVAATLAVVALICGSTGAGAPIGLILGIAALVIACATVVWELLDPGNKALAYMSGLLAWVEKFEKMPTSYWKARTIELMQDDDCFKGTLDDCLLIERVHWQWARVGGGFKGSYEAGDDDWHYYAKEVDGKDVMSLPDRENYGDARVKGTGKREKGGWKELTTDASERGKLVEVLVRFNVYEHDDVTCDNKLVLEFAEKSLESIEKEKDLAYFSLTESRINKDLIDSATWQWIWTDNMESELKFYFTVEIELKIGGEVVKTIESDRSTYVVLKKQDD